MPISLTKLRQLIAIAHNGSLSKAADALHISQPALSRSIALIEETYAVKLFDRTSTGVTLTNACRQIVAEAESLLRSADSLDHNLRLHGQGEIGRVSVGVGSLISSLILTDLGKYLFKKRPSVQLHTLIRPTPWLLDELLKNEIDFLIGVLPDEVPEEVVVRPVGRLSTSLIVRAGHPLAQTGPQGIANVLNYPIACSVEAGWARKGNAAGGSFVCDNFHTIREVVLETDLVWIGSPAFVYRDLAAGTLVKLEVPEAPVEHEFDNEKSRIFVCTLQGRSLSPISRELISFCESFFGKDI